MYGTFFKQLSQESKAISEHLTDAIIRDGFIKEEAKNSETLKQKLASYINDYVKEVGAEKFLAAMSIWGV